MWHKTDWKKVSEDPKSIAMPREDWIHFHDAETHAEEVFDEIFKKHLGTSGTLPATHKPFVEHSETVPTLSA